MTGVETRSSFMALTPDSAFRIRVVELPRNMIQLLLIEGDLSYSRRALTRENHLWLARTCGRLIRMTELATRVSDIGGYG